MTGKTDRKPTGGVDAASLRRIYFASGGKRASTCQYLSFPFSFSFFFPSHDSVSRREIVLHVFARNEISSKTFILIRYRELRLSVQTELALLVRDVCDSITITIPNENLQFRMQSIRKFRLSMVITNSDCNL